MNRGESKWIQRVGESHIPEEMIKALEISPLILKLILNRGVKDIDEIRDYMSFDYNPTENLDKLKDAEKLISVLLDAISEKKKIVIYGDYDVDGITSSSIYLKTFEAIGYPIDFYIPDRIDEGYGLNSHAITYLKEKEYDIVISVDCGITSVDETKLAKDIGLNLYITDHHQCPEELPDSEIIVNPMQNQCLYPYKGLVAAGISHKICSAILDRFSKDSGDFSATRSEISILAALGTVADVGSLKGENRKIVKSGLKSLEINGYLQIEEFAPKNATPFDMGFRVGPRINAAGRINKPQIGVEYLIESDVGKIKELSQKLTELNNERREIEAEVVIKSREHIDTALDLLPSLIIVSHESFHSGVIGIAASRLAERYHRPVIVLSKDEEKMIYKSSVRSIRGIDIYEFLSKFSHMFIKFGGHKAAAGFSISIDSFPKFKEMAILEAEKAFDKELFTPTYEYDFQLRAGDINYDFLDDLTIIEPVGVDNPKPVFMINGGIIERLQIMGKDKNVGKISLLIENRVFECILFKIDYRFKMLKTGDSLDLLFELEKNTFNGITNIQLVVKDYKHSLKDEEKRLASTLAQIAVDIEGIRPDKSVDLKRLKDNIKNIPTREMLVKVYKALKSRSVYGETTDLRKIKEQLGITELDALISIAIMKNAGILNYQLFGFRVNTDFVEVNDKIDILNSYSYKTLNSLLNN